MVGAGKYNPTTITLCAMSALEQHCSPSALGKQLLGNVGPTWEGKKVLGEKKKGRAELARCVMRGFGKGPRTHPLTNPGAMVWLGWL